MNTKAIVIRTPAELRAKAEKLAGKAREFAEGSQAANTVRAYENDWKHFEAWAQGFGLAALPADPETVALYVTDLASLGFKVSTIERRLIAINHFHKQFGDDRPASHPGVRQVMKGIRRKIKVKPVKKRAIQTEQIRAWIETLGSSPADVRDRAIILIGYAGAFRRSELAGLQLADVRFESGGLLFTLRQSKTNQEGKLEQVAIPAGQHPETDPVRALRAWLDLANITDGPLFRRIRSGRHYSDKITAEGISPKWISVIVKNICKTLKLSSHECREYSGHSLRAGHITEAQANGAPEGVTMRQSRHKSADVFRGYVRPEDLFKINSAAFLDL